MKTTGVIVIAFAMLIAITGVVMADQVIPAYGNIVQTGSKYDLAVGSIFSTADNRFVGTDATEPVVLNYAINVKPYTISGQGTSPAMGTVSSFFQSSIKEGGTGYWGGVTNPLIATGGNYDYIGRAVFVYPFIYGAAGPVYQPIHWDDVMIDMAIGTDGLLDVGPQNMDLTYSESSSASGIINSYSAAYQYQSGKVLF